MAAPTLHTSCTCATALRLQAKQVQVPPDLLLSKSLSPCDVEALKRCLEQNHGDHKKVGHALAPLLLGHAVASAWNVVQVCMCACMHMQVCVHGACVYACMHLCQCKHACVCIRKGLPACLPAVIARTHAAFTYSLCTCNTIIH